MTMRITLVLVCFVCSVRPGLGDDDCYNDIATYDGKMSVTATGRACQRWDRPWPHRHIMEPANFPEYTKGASRHLTYSRAENYCRDPDRSGFLWCFTTDPKIQWEKCVVKRCAENTDCYDDTATYGGKTSVTTSGRACQRWNRQWPHRHNMMAANFPEYTTGAPRHKTYGRAQNYCRDPDRSGFLWCFTTDPKTQWERCEVKRCADTDSDDESPPDRTVIHFNAGQASPPDRTVIHYNAGLASQQERRDKYLSRSQKHRSKNTAFCFIPKPISSWVQRGSCVTQVTIVGRGACSMHNPSIINSIIITGSNGRTPIYTEDVIQECKRAYEESCHAFFIRWTFDDNLGRRGRCVQVVGCYGRNSPNIFRSWAECQSKCGHRFF